MIQPELGQRLEQIRLTAKNGKKMGRAEFAKLVNLSPTQLRNVEQGRKLKDEELAGILAAYPELGVSAFESEPPALHAPMDDEADEISGGWDFPVEQRTKVTQVWGDLVALDEELEDLETQEATPTSTLLGVTTLTDVARIFDVPVSVVTGGSAEAGAAEPASQAAGPLVRQENTYYVSNSELQTFKRCRRKWWLAWYRNLRPKNEDVLGARATGTRFHVALKALYVPHGQQPADPRDALERAITEDWTKLTQLAAEQGFDSVPPEVAKEFHDANSLERAMVEGYVEWLAEEAPDRGLQVIAPETYLEMPVEMSNSNVNVVLIGKLDVRVYRESDGVSLFIDHKTVGDFTRPVKTLHLDEQMLTYHLLEWSNAVEAGRCDGALYNMARKVKRTARATPPFYKRVEVRHNPHELESFRKRLIGTVAQILQVKAHLDTGTNPLTVVYPTPRSECSWDCDFFSICGMFDDGSRVEDAIEAYYDEVDPLDRYTGDEEK